MRLAPIDWAIVAAFLLLSLLIELLKKAKGRKGDPTSLARRAMD